MKSFLKRCFFLSILLYIFLWILQWFADYGLRYGGGNDENLWPLLSAGMLDSDISILGSSRALKQYDPRIFENKLNLKTYNLGVNGAGYGLQLIKIKEYLNKNTSPKVIVLNVDLSSLYRNKQLINKEQYFPYYYSINNIKILSRTDKNVLSEVLIPMLKYRGYQDKFYEGFSYLFSNKKKDNRGYYRGYQSVDKFWEGELKVKKGDLRNITEAQILNGLTDFEKILEQIDLVNSKLVLVWSPEYEGLRVFSKDDMDKLKLLYQEKANSNPNIYFLDFTEDELNYNIENFFDFNHLNKNGATLFSHMVADSLKVILSNN